jgi:hypothetical protein
MNPQTPKEEWWMIIERAHREDWNLYEASSPTRQTCNESEQSLESEAVQLDSIQSDLPEKNISE